MTILVAEKDCILWGLYFVTSQNMAALSHKRPASTRGGGCRTVTDVVFSKAIKEHTVLNLFLLMSIILNKIMRWLMKK
jgi:hypothetical protein